MGNLTKEERQRRLILKPCGTDDQLHAWAQAFLGLKIPREPVCAGHDAPFEYVRRAYFEPAGDVVVWAPRGGGKTRLGALATLLDLMHKPGVQVRILGGSLEQSSKMWEHLESDLHRLAIDLVDDRASGKKRVVFKSSAGGASVGVLAQSQKAVRGLRVQKLRCDEVEMFDPRVWEAAQMSTKSLDTPAAGSRVAASVEALSTFHKPWGLMNGVVDRAKREGTRVIKWCVMEVLERCPEARDCSTCGLEEDCHGIAKTKCDGFYSLDDVLRIKRRVSKEAWDSEMMCRRPNVTGRVFPHFEREVHVREEAGGRQGDGATQPELRLAIDFGFANPFVCLWVAVSGDVNHVLDEYVMSGRTVGEHADEIERITRSRGWAAAKVIACDPAGNGRNDQTALSNVALLRRRGYTVRTRGSMIQDGIELLRHALRPALGEPTLFVHPRCERLIKALECYHYPETRAGGSETPVKDGENDHPIDALRYHFVNRVSTAARGGVRY